MIIPAFNEEKRLPWTLCQIGMFLDQWGVDYRVVVADDGSADRTPELTGPLGPRFSTVRLAQHGGKGCAVRTAMLQATGRVVAFTDADLPFELSALREGYEWIHQRTCEVVFGARDIEGRQAHRRAAAGRGGSPRPASARSSNVSISREVTDTQCGLKLFGRRAAREIFSRATIDGFAFDAEVVFLTRRLRLPFRRVPVSLIHDYDSTLSLRRHALPMLWDVIWLRLREWLGPAARRADRPVAARGNFAAGRRAGGGRPEKTGGVMNAGRSGLTASDSRRLVLHADDLGMNRLVSEGILHGFRTGPLTSASLLSNGPDAARALQQWGELCADQRSGGLPSSPLRQRLDDRGRPFDLGIHLNLTEGRPLDAAAYPPELLDEEGCFPGVSALFGRLHRSGGRFREALANELSRQTQFMLDHGARPTHLNGHQYIELLPGVRELIPALMKKFGIRVVRTACEPSTWRLLLGRGKGVLGKVRAGRSSITPGNSAARWTAWDLAGWTLSSERLWPAKSTCDGCDASWPDVSAWRKSASIPGWPATPKKTIGPILWRRCGRENSICLSPRTWPIILSRRGSDWTDSGSWPAHE